MDFLESVPTFDGLPVKIRKYPFEFGKEEAFFHLTCQDYMKSKERFPDFKRSERLKWCRSFIDNWNKCADYICSNCNGLKIWKEPFKKTFQVCILSEEYKYIVVLEKRENYYLLITGYYIEFDHVMRKKLANYEKYRHHIR